MCAFVVGLLSQSEDLAGVWSCVRPNLDPGLHVYHHKIYLSCGLAFVLCDFPSKAGLVKLSKWPRPPPPPVSRGILWQHPGADIRKGILGLQHCWNIFSCSPKTQLSYQKPPTINCPSSHWEQKTSLSVQTQIWYTYLSPIIFRFKDSRYDSG